jgi:O-antigen/teichoic acid export membrane protein
MKGLTDVGALMQWLSRFWVGRLPKDSFVRGVGALAGGTTLAQAIGLLASPLLTRLYTAEDFGYLQIYVSVLAFLFVVVGWRYELAILLPEAEDTAASLLVLALGIVGTMSLLCAGMIWWVHGSDVLPLQIKPLQPYLWLMPISLSGAGAYVVLSYWALRQKAYPQVATTKLTQSVGQIATQLLLGAWFKTGVLGLLLGDAIGRVAGSARLAGLAWQQNEKLFRAVRWNGMWKAAVRYKRFPLVSSGAALINTGGFALPSLMLGAFFGSQVLGWFALVDRVMAAPAVLIGVAVSQVYSVEVARVANTEPAGMRSLFVKLMKKLALIGAIPYALVFMAGPWLFGFVFGEPWREAGIYARLLAVMHWVGFIAWPLTPTLNLLEEQTRQLWWDVGRLILTLACLCLPYYLGLPARLTIAAYGGAMFIGYVAHLFLSHRAIQTRIKRATISGQPE